MTGRRLVILCGARRTEAVAIAVAAEGGRL